MMADELEAALARVASKSQGRTRYEGQPPYDDELMLMEIASLRTQFFEQEQRMFELEREYAALNSLHKQANAQLSLKDKALRDLDAVLDFSEPVSAVEGGIQFDDVTSVNEAFAAAIQALHTEGKSDE